MQPEVVVLLSPCFDDNDLSKRLGVIESVLGRWKREAKQASPDAFSGKGHQTSLEEENRRLRKEVIKLKEERAILKDAAVFFCARNKVKFHFIKRRRGRFSVTTMCSVLGVSRPGFYAWLHRRPTARSLGHRELVTRINIVHAASKKQYGAKRVYRQLLREGVQFGCHQVAALMRPSCLKGRHKRKIRTTTVANTDHRVVANILNCDFNPTARDRAWCADITYIWTLKGWLYLAVILDLFSRRVVGWETSKNIDEKLALDALDMAIAECQPRPGTVVHSDRSCQYTARGYKKRLVAQGLVQSMSRRGNYWNNAVAESFFTPSKLS